MALLKFGTLNIAATVDRIGEIDAITGPLLKEREKLAAALKAIGPGRYTGELWSATVAESVRTTVDWKTIAARFEPSRQLITAHTSETPVVTLRVNGV